MGIQSESHQLRTTQARPGAQRSAVSAASGLSHGTESRELSRLAQEWPTFNSTFEASLTTNTLDVIHFALPILVRPPDFGASEGRAASQRPSASGSPPGPSAREALDTASFPWQGENKAPVAAATEAVHRWLHVASSPRRRCTSFHTERQGGRAAAWLLGRTALARSLNLFLVAVGDRLRRSTALPPPPPLPAIPGSPPPARLWSRCCPSGPGCPGSRGDFPQAAHTL